MIRLIFSLLAAVACGIVAPAAAAQDAAPKIGIVVMHGKGGNPSGIIKPLADGLEARGFGVASLEMPWSKRRSYDKDVATAVQEVQQAIAQLKNKGAQKVFVAGHSQGAVFAIHYASRQPPDGLIVIAPGGNVGTAFYQGKVGGAVSQAREMLESGKGGETGDFDEFEGGRSWTVRTTAASYFSWFDPQGAMNQMKSSAALPKSLPVLHVAPTSDYPALLRAKDEMFDALPAHPLRRLYEPSSNHRNAPRDSVDEIARWVTEVAAR